MNDRAMIDAIKTILARVKEEPELALRLPDSADIIEDVGLDSLEMLSFMLGIEQDLAIQIDFNKLSFEHLRSIAVLSEFLLASREEQERRPGA
jgi:acyl carrier protein